MERRLVKEFKNGNKLWERKVRCEKCSGTGVIPYYYSVAHGVCFDCDGLGWYWSKETEYTPENLAKLEAKRAKEEEKRRAEAAARQAEREAREAEEAARQAEWEAKRRGHYYGEIGQKIEIDVTFVYATSFETVYGTMNVHRFDTDDGAHLVWKTSSEIGGKWGSKGFKIVDEGDRIRISATIKDHKEYRGIEQTELTRVKLISGGHDPEPEKPSSSKPVDLDEIWEMNGWNE